MPSSYTTGNLSFVLSIFITYNFKMNFIYKLQSWQAMFLEKVIQYQKTRYGDMDGQEERSSQEAGDCGRAWRLWLRNP